METKVIQVRGRGAVTLPSRIRERYGLEEGDPLTIVDLDGILVLVPRVGVVDKLTAEIARLREGAGLSVDDLIAGVREERARYYTERLGKRS
ncbi:MAG: AbrB/MazE/SpoVT family DNA-binding domain-containing protein [Actinomycetota bacterium]